jgi:hypothetical protein
MPDTFGGIQIPILPPIEGQPVTDPALKHLADFVQAVLNKYSAEAWKAVDKRNPPVAHTFTHDPEKYEISDNTFPAVFVYRTGSTTTWFGDDYCSDVAAISILWLFEPAQQNARTDRASFFNGILKPLYRAFHRGRSPAWVVEGEDAAKVSRGSLLWSRCGFLRERVRSAVLDGLTVEMVSNGKSREYDGVLITLEAEERLFEDPAEYVGGGAAALTADLKNGSADILRAVEKPPEA